MALKIQKPKPSTKAKAQKATPTVAVKHLVLIKDYLPMVKHEKSFYLKVRMLLQSVIAGGKETEQEKMRKFLIGASKPTDAHGVQAAIHSLKNLWDKCMETQDFGCIIALLVSLDEHLN